MKLSVGILSIITFALQGSLSASADEDVKAAVAAAEDCFEKYVEDVERMGDDLLVSTSVLVGGLCVVEVQNADNALSASLRLQKEQELDSACGELPENWVKQPFDVYAEIDFDKEADDARVSQIRACRSQYVYSHQRFTEDQSDHADQTALLTSKASRMLLEKRIARLDGAPIGDK